MLRRFTLSLLKHDFIKCGLTGQVSSEFSPNSFCLNSSKPQITCHVWKTEKKKKKKTQITSHKEKGHNTYQGG